MDCGSVFSGLADVTAFIGVSCGTWEEARDGRLRFHARVMPGFPCCIASRPIAPRVRPIVEVFAAAHHARRLRCVRKHGVYRDSDLLDCRKLRHEVADGDVDGAAAGPCAALVLRARRNAGRAGTGRDPAVVATLPAPGPGRRGDTGDRTGQRRTPARDARTPRDPVAARAELEGLSADAAATGSVVLLTDEAGWILDAEGSTGFLERAGRVALMPGACWSERARHQCHRHRDRGEPLDRGPRRRALSRPARHPQLCRGADLRPLRAVGGRARHLRRRASAAHPRAGTGAARGRQHRAPLLRRRHRRLRTAARAPRPGPARHRARGPAGIPRRAPGGSQPRRPAAVRAGAPRTGARALRRAVRGAADPAAPRRRPVRSPGPRPVRARGRARRRAAAPARHATTDHGLGRPPGR